MKPISNLTIARMKRDEAAVAYNWSRDNAIRAINMVAMLNAQRTCSLLMIDNYRADEERATYPNPTETDAQKAERVFGQHRR